MFSCCIFSVKKKKPNQQHLTSDNSNSKLHQSSRIDNSHSDSSRADKDNEDKYEASRANDTSAMSILLDSASDKDKIFDNDDDDDDFKTYYEVVSFRLRRIFRHCSVSEAKEEQKTLLFPTAKGL